MELMMELLLQYWEIVSAVIMAVASPFIAKAIQPKANLINSVPHGWVYLIQQPLMNPDTGMQVSPTQSLHTQSHEIFNAGKDKAGNVEIVFNWKPLCTNVWPSRQFEEIVREDGRYHIVFGSLAASESVKIEIFDLNQNLPGLMNIRSDQGNSNQVIVQSQKVPSNRLMMLVKYLMFSGLLVTFYVIAEGLEWLYRAVT